MTIFNRYIFKIHEKNEEKKMKNLENYRNIQKQIFSKFWLIENFQKKKMKIADFF